MMKQQNSRVTDTLRVRIGKVAALLALLIGFSGVGFSGAAALPPDGPGPESPGTSSRVWPTTVRAGDTLNFEVSGYPANETVYIKIDDGTACSDTSHGACVYHTQKLDANGYASGSIVVPALEPGAHWLRMLATGDVFDEKTGEKIGYNGYTRRGGNDFTVVAGTGGGGSGGGAGGGSVGAAGSGAVNADGTVEGGEVSLDAGEEEGDTKKEEGSEPESMDDLTENVSDETQSDASRRADTADEGGLPVVGIAALGASLLIGGGALAWVLLRKRPAVAAPDEGSHAEASALE